MPARSTETKNCVICGLSFGRPLNTVTHIWKAKRFCSLNCKEWSKTRGYLELDENALKDLLCYDPQSGFITWRYDRHGISANNRAEHSDADGYLIVKIRFKAKDYNFKAHRLAWLLYYGIWPSQEIDHIDYDKSNNSINNLRDISSSHNRSRSANKKNLPRGVSLHPRTPNKPYKVQIGVNKTYKNLGYFASLDEAVAAYNSAYFSAHGRDHWE